MYIIRYTFCNLFVLILHSTKELLKYLSQDDLPDIQIGGQMQKRDLGKLRCFLYMEIHICNSLLTKKIYIFDNWVTMAPIVAQCTVLLAPTGAQEVHLSL